MRGSKVFMVRPAYLSSFSYSTVAHKALDMLPVERVLLTRLPFFLFESIVWCLVTAVIPNLDESELLWKVKCAPW